MSLEHSLEVCALASNVTLENASILRSREERVSLPGQSIGPLPLSLDLVEGDRG